MSLLLLFNQPAPPEPLPPVVAGSPRAQLIRRPQVVVDVSDDDEAALLLALIL